MLSTYYDTTLFNWIESNLSNQIKTIKSNLLKVKTVFLFKVFSNDLTSSFVPNQYNNNVWLGIVELKIP